MPDYTDPKQGGDLSDMAATGTSMPNDAGVMNLIKSVPRPDQISNVNDLGTTDPALAADNAVDMPSSSGDQGLNPEIFTATGASMPAHTDSKRLFETPGGTNPATKGHGRDEKHGKQTGADQELGAGDGPGVQKGAGVKDT